MKDIIKKEDCTGCMACKSICPKKAITIKIQDDGFSYPEIDETKCIKCGLCKKVCPVINQLKENENEIEVYACKNKNEEIRMKSSSGGIFTMIAQWILNQKGVVFGVKLNEDLEAVHSYTENEEGLEAFRGSKYVQSQIGNSYQDVKLFLEQDRKVLFTGTPCQVEALLSYLGKEYSNLYTQDFICHGVPSPVVWKRHLENKSTQTGEMLTKVEFRKKDNLGWQNYEVYYKYEQTEERIMHKEDSYMRLFLDNVILRKSCYHCQFKKLKRKSDITLADFWGISKAQPEFSDNIGVSAVLINSKKGRKLFELIKNQINYCKGDIKDIIKYNSCICKSVNYNEEREQFFKDF